MFSCLLVSWTLKEIEVSMGLGTTERWVRAGRGVPLMLLSLHVVLFIVSKPHSAHSLRYLLFRFFINDWTPEW
jgi:hypothetical protein